MALDDDDVARLGEVARSSQQVADYLRAQTARFGQGETRSLSRERPERPTPIAAATGGALRSTATASQTDVVETQHVDTQAAEEAADEQPTAEAAHQLVHLSAQLEARERELQQAVKQRDALEAQILALNERMRANEHENANSSWLRKLHFKFSSMFSNFSVANAVLKLQQREEENAALSATISELAATRTQLLLERDAHSGSHAALQQRYETQTAHIEQLEAERENQLAAAAEQTRARLSAHAERDALERELRATQQRVDELHVTKTSPPPPSAPTLPIETQSSGMQNYLLV